MLQFQLPEEASQYSFVGIEDGKFFLPLGMRDKITDPNDPRLAEFFFQFYKMFRRYERDLLTASQEPERDKRDGIRNPDGSINLTYHDENDEEKTERLYARINLIDAITGVFDELGICGLASREGYDSQNDQLQIENCLDDAIFLPNGAIYVDETMVARKVIAFNEAEIVDMFCFIYHEVKSLLEEAHEVPAEVKTFGARFVEEHLFPGASLFGQDWQSVVATLKERLEIIDTQTHYKDESFWRYYEAIEKFLYNPLGSGTNGYWGLKKFSPLWEELNLDYMFKHYKDNMLYADTVIHKNCQLLDGHQRGFYCNNSSDSYPFVLTAGEVKKYIYPDLVLKGSFEGKIETEDFTVKGKTYKENTYYAMHPIKDCDSERYCSDRLLRLGFKIEEIGGSKSRCVIPLSESLNYINKEKRNEDFEEIKNSAQHEVIDFKYKDNPDAQDAIKQHLYEACLSGKTVSVFFLPGYENSENLYVSTDQKSIMNAKVNLKILLKEYIDESRSAE